jgi:acylphosphatase
MKKLKAKIFGRVQGVYFRKTTQSTARDLGLLGWIQNLPDGSVELEAIGNENALKKLLSFCQKGPELAEVERVDVEWDEASELDLKEFSEFKVKRSGSVIQDQFNSFRNLGKKVFNIKSSRRKDE